MELRQFKHVRGLSIKLVSKTVMENCEIRLSCSTNYFFPTNIWHDAKNWNLLLSLIIKALHPNKMKHKSQLPLLNVCPPLQPSHYSHLYVLLLCESQLT